MTRTPQDLLPGSLDALVLESFTTGELHGFDVSRWVRERTGGVLDVPDAALYKALHRLQERGWLRARWGLSENRRKAKFYSLTEAGRRGLADEKAAWSTFAAAVHRALGTAS